MQINKSVSMAKQPVQIEIELKNLNDVKVQSVLLDVLRKYYGKAKEQ